MRWTVRNRGHEAWTKNDIGHLSGEEYEANEHSAYNGNHAMDLTVNQWSRIIGRHRNVHDGIHSALTVVTLTLAERTEI